ncbi:hypothetical protein FisN_5Lh403 [Fistulifera solaris]|uniref:Ysc84 actin-binding domain-containing protein n=1 Tax=Fistulifera solaris TaxID=1519565 RepID=A0A1Z5KG96_FISSO|nr:hypothetical protein FisN_5Lh403 [Fistulifera solaris]|eukprot:GAX25313.1 hypothetical protein FisN_5Lh403 [Fistulifera solaris]
MIWRADKVLDRALDPKQRGIPKDVFDKCKGVILLSSIEAGFTFTGKLGTGIFLVKKRDGSWSIPSAIGLTSVGGGFVIGASLKESMIFIMDQQTLEALAVNNGVKLGAQAELTLFKWGRSYNLALNCSPSGYGGTVSLAFSKGLFGGLTLEGAVVGARRSVNENFYGTNASVLQIVTDEEVAMPQGTKIDEVYRKLDVLKNVGSVERT